ncbi:MAG: glycosyltransferase, partial [Lachnospiraceae bacterium]|nr:glycosyltransferase [Lachnospiraceae bacterium]
MPTVSVIMPMYNSVKFVKQAIESILGQTYKDLEIIAIND